MKTFTQFILIAEDKMGQRLGNMSDADFDHFLKGRTPGESQTYREKRVKFKKTNVSSKDAGFGRQQSNPSQSSTTSQQSPKQSAETPPRSTQQTRGGNLAQPTTSGSGGNKPPTKVPGKPRIPGAEVAYAAYDTYNRTKERQNKGENLPSAVTKSAAEAGSGLAGSVAAIRAAAPITARLKNPLAIGAANIAIGSAGYAGGAGGAERIVKRLEGPTNNDVEKAAQKYGMNKARSGMQKANVYGARQGSAITGIGKNTSFDKKAGTITSQGKTAKLASTQLIRDPKSGKNTVGDLAYKGGKATYLARPSTASRDSNATPGGAWRNLQRSLNIGGQRERDSAASKTEYRSALKNTQTYQKQLGISPQAATSQKLPGRGVGSEVGPKLVGPKIVGPAKVGPTKPQSPAKQLIKPA